MWNFGIGGELWPVCGFHLESEKGFFITKSAQNNHDSGFGLYTIKSFRKGAEVVELVGPIISKKQTNETPSKDRGYYAIVKDKHNKWYKTVDATDPNLSSIARYVNNGRDECNLVSCTISYADIPDPDWNVLCATKEITASKESPVELLLNYNERDENFGNEVKGKRKHDDLGDTTEYKPKTRTRGGEEGSRESRQRRSRRSSRRWSSDSEDL